VRTISPAYVCKQKKCKKSIVSRTCTEELDGKGGSILLRPGEEWYHCFFFFERSSMSPSIPPVPAYSCPSALHFFVRTCTPNPPKKPNTIQSGICICHRICFQVLEDESVGNFHPSCVSFIWLVFVYQYMLLLTALKIRIASLYM